MSNEAFRRAAQASDHAIGELGKIAPFLEIGARSADREQLTTYGLAIISALTDALAQTRTQIENIGARTRPNK